MKRYFGISAYAGMHVKFPVRRFMQQFPDDLKNGCIAVLSGSFGWSTALIKAFAERFPTGLIEVHMGNGAGRRRMSQDKGEFAKGYSCSDYNGALIAKQPKLVSMIHTRLERIAEKVLFIAPTCKYVLCPELEDNMSDVAFMCACEIIRDYWPEVVLVRSSCGKGKALNKAKYYERHGIVYNGKPGEILNMDGVSLDAKDGSRYFQRASEATVGRMLDTSSAFATMIWSARQQGYPNLPNFAATPPKRSRTFEVSDQEIAMMRRLLAGR